MPVPRVALVTGSGKRRVGWYVAEALGQRGYALVVHYHRSVQEAGETVAHFQERGFSVLAVQADLGEESQVQELVQRTLGHFGRLDVLVHCAATWARRKLEDLSAADVRHDFASNSLSSFLCAQHAGLAMVKQPEGGCIILLGDWATGRPYLDHAAYFLSKGAIPTLTRTMAVELASRNPRVRVNCILPGPVMMPADRPDAERQAAIRATLVQREGTPQHVAQAVQFLIDNDFVTGVCLPVDGGRSLHGGEV